MPNKDFYLPVHLLFISLLMIVTSESAVSSGTELLKPTDTKGRLFKQGLT